MSCRTVRLPGSIGGKAVVLAIMMGAICDTAMAGRKTRLFTFENGTVGGAAPTALNTITGPFTGVPDTVLGVPSDYYDVGPAGIPGGSQLNDWITANYDPSPDFTAV